MQAPRKTERQHMTLTTSARAQVVVSGATQQTGLKAMPNPATAVSVE